MLSGSYTSILREPGSWKVDNTGLRLDRRSRVEHSDSIFEIRSDQSGNPVGEKYRTICGIPFRYLSDPASAYNFDIHIKLTLRERFREQFYFGAGVGAIAVGLPVLVWVMYFKVIP